MPPSKSRWKFSFGRSSPTSSSSPSSSSFSSSSSPSIKEQESVPMSFMCPISSSLMADPVIVPTGLTFERCCIEACRELGFTPPCLSNVDLSSSNFFLIPNTALRAAIVDCCDRLSLPHPSPVSLDSARCLVLPLMKLKHHQSPPPISLQQRQQQQNEEELALSYPSSSSSTSSSSSEITSDDTPKAKTPPPLPTVISPTDSDPLEEEIFRKLKSSHLSAKESGLVTLRLSARESSERRISLSTSRLLAALVPLISLSSSPAIQTNVTAAVVNLSVEPANKVKIVRAGAVPPLVEALRPTSRSCGEARGNAAGALFSLAMEDENKLAMGALGTIPPLLSLFCCPQPAAGHLARVEAGMALYHLSLAPNNLGKIARMAGAVKALLNVAVGGGKWDEQEEESAKKEKKQLRRVAMMVLASLVRRNEGMTALIDADGVRLVVGMMKESAAQDDECSLGLGVLYEMSKGTSLLRFRALARAARAEDVLAVLAENEEGRGEVTKQMARRTLKVVRGRDQEKGLSMSAMLGDEELEEEEEGELASVLSDGLVSFRRRYEFDDSSASNSANF